MLVRRTTAEALPTRFVRLDPGRRSIWRTEYLGPPPSARGATLDHGIGRNEARPISSPTPALRWRTVHWQALQIRSRSL